MNTPHSVPPSDDHEPADVPPSGVFAGRTRYWDGYLATGLCAIALITASTLRGFRGSLTFWLMGLLSSYLLMTLLEYFWHRRLFHHGFGSMRAGHTLHHRAPDEPFGLPWQLPVVVLLALAGSLWWLDSAWLTALGLVAISRVITSAMHNALHFFNWRWAPFQWFKRHHELHHHNARINFAITFPPWDVVFGTSAKKN